MKGILLMLVAAAVFGIGYVIMERVDEFLDAYAHSEERDESSETEATEDSP